MRDRSGLPGWFAPTSFAFAACMFVLAALSVSGVTSGGSAAAVFGTIAIALGLGYLFLVLLAYRHRRR